MSPRLALALRLRYEIRRQFAPCVGVTRARDVGGTAGQARARGGRVQAAQVVAGIRLRF
jgi:copper resistance protein B